MRDPVESVATDVVLLVQVIGQRIHVRHPGNRRVKCSVERCHLFHAWQSAACRADAGQVGRVVQRRQVCISLDRSDHLVVHEHRLGELLSAVDHTVPYRADLRQTAQDPDIRVDQRVEYEVHRIFHIQRENRTLVNLMISPVRQLRYGLAHPLHRAIGDHVGLGHFIQVVLHRGTAGVDHEDLHLRRAFQRTPGRSSTLGLWKLPQGQDHCGYDIIHCRTARQVRNRLGKPLKKRADRSRAGHVLSQFVCDVP